MSRPRQQMRAAYHEAGHAVARHVLGLEITAVEIHPDGTGISHGTGNLFCGGAEIHKHVLYALAGPAAEARAAKASRWSVFLSGGAVDLAAASALIRMMGPVDPWLDIYCREARSLVGKHWPTIERVVKALLLASRLDADELRVLIEPGSEPMRRRA